MIFVILLENNFFVCHYADELVCAWAKDIGACAKVVCTATLVVLVCATALRNTRWFVRKALICHAKRISNDIFWWWVFFSFQLSHDLINDRGEYNSRLFWLENMYIRIECAQKICTFFGDAKDFYIKCVKNVIFYSFDVECFVK